MIDLLCLVADKNMEAVASRLLDRPESLGIRRVTREIVVHDRRDPGCFHHAGDILLGYRSRAAHALVILDHAWDGVPAETAVEVEGLLEGRFRRDGMGDWARAVVIQPELEAWVFSGSPHVESALGWSGRSPGLREALTAQRLWAPGSDKPDDPKKAMEWALVQRRLPRSSSIYRELASKVSTRSCTDRAFQRLRRLLQEWFPPTG
ncbi:MAG: hypothetical protein OXG52_11880 [bacterium]|nr:hypothetical protein [bacterium]